MFPDRRLELAITLIFTHIYRSAIMWLVLIRKARRDAFLKDFF